MTYKNWHIILIVSALICTMASCASDSPEPEPIVCHKTDSSPSYMVSVLAPGYYDTAETNSRGLTEDIIDGLDKHSFADGTTMWILVEMKVPDPDGGADSVYVQEPLNTSYAVRRTTAVVNGVEQTVAEMVPCNCDDDGNLIDYKSGHLYLTPGVYRIRAVSPAKHLEDDCAMTIGNGMQVLATDYRYAHTSPKDMRIYEVIENADGSIYDPNSTNGIVVYNLATMINQTARIEFDIYVDDSAKDYITQIEPMHNGCELSGLFASDDFNWTSTMDSETEPMHIYLDKKDDKFTITNDRFSHVNDDPTKLTCGVCILPTNATSSTLMMTFNLRVNNVPTQFITSITNTIFEHGINYKYKIRLTWNEGIVVASWYNDSSITDVEL